jgi:hypothetical protein
VEVYGYIGGINATETDFRNLKPTLEAIVNAILEQFLHVKQVPGRFN